MYCSIKKGRAEALPFFLLFFDIEDLTSVIHAACLACTMGHAESTTVGALYNAWSRELPCRRTTLVTALSGNFSFRDCHSLTPPDNQLFMSSSIIIYLSKSCSRTANLGSTSLRQSHGPSLRSFPHFGHIPMQSSRHRNFVSISRIKPVAITSSASIP